VALYASYKMDYPTGAAIVCVMGLCLVLSILVFKLRASSYGINEPPDI